MGETQIEGKGPQVGSKRRARLQSSWWCSHEPLGAARADAAVQPHLGDVGLNFGNFDAVVGLSRLLDHTGDVRSAMRAMFGQNVAFPGRVRMQWTMRPGMRLALGLASLLPLTLLSLRRRRAGVVRRFRRQLLLRPQRGVLFLQRRKALAQLVDPRQQRGDQRVFLGTRQRGRIKRWSHPG